MHLGNAFGVFICFQGYLFPSCGDQTCDEYEYSRNRVETTQLVIRIHPSWETYWADLLITFPSTWLTFKWFKRFTFSTHIASKVLQGTLNSMTKGTPNTKDAESIIITPRSTRTKCLELYMHADSGWCHICNHVSSSYICIHHLKCIQ